MATSGTQSAGKGKGGKPFWARKNFLAADDHSKPADTHAKEINVALVGSGPRFVNVDTGFAIWTAEHLDDRSRRITVKGPLARLTPGEQIACEGKWVHDKQYGWSFKTDDYHASLPTGAKGVIEWLTHRVPGVGPTYAKAIVDHFGAEDVFRMLDESPERLREIKSPSGRAFSSSQVEKAIDAWHEVKAIREIETFLYDHGVTKGLADKLYRRYGDDVKKVLTEDTYRITELWGVGFKVADKIAKTMGVPLDDPKRVQAGIMFLLQEAESQGHVFVYLKELFALAARLLEVSDQYLLAAQAGELAKMKRIVVEQDSSDAEQRIYSRSLYDMECRLAQKVRTILDTPGPELFPDPPRPTAPKGASEEEALALKLPTDEQWETLELVRMNRLCLLLGGPGVGKCVRGETPVLVNDRLIEIQRLWEDSASSSLTFDGEGEWSLPSQPLMTVALDEATGKMVPAQVSKLYRQQVKEKLRRVLLDDGSEIVMTQRHRLFGVEGWQRELAVGDSVAVPARLPQVRGARVDPDLVYLLAWQISEGCETRGGDGRRGTVSISQNDIPLLENVRAAARRFGAKNGLEMYSMPIDQPTNKTPSLLICSAPYRSWLEENGYKWGKLSGAKTIPDFIMQADDESIRLFLREFFSAEGSVVDDARLVEITSASRVLMWQVALLLRRFGIWMRIKKKTKWATNSKTRKKRTYYTGYIGGPSLRLFRDKIGFSNPAKQALLAVLEDRVTNSNVELVPCKDLLAQLRPLTGLGKQSFGVSSVYLEGKRDMSGRKCQQLVTRLDAMLDGSYSANLPTDGAGSGNYTAVREKLAAMDTATVQVVRDQLAERGEREVFYATVIEIEEIEHEGYVYDLEVAEHHNYIACNIVSHNTATVNTIVTSAVAAGKKVSLAAPTGKAARRMRELSGHYASTIHKLLEYSPIDGSFERDEQNPIETDLLVIDEASMLSLDLADSLFQAVGPKTHVLLVGDPDQLPPVGAGRVLADLIEARVAAEPAVPRVHLERIFRQAAKSMIVRNARLINQGEMPLLTHEAAVERYGDEMDKDFYYIGTSTYERAVAVTVEMVVERIPRVYGHDPVKDIMVLAPMHKGPLGLDVLNKTLEERLNPGLGGQAPKAVVPGRGIRVGSRIMQTKNSYEEGKEVMNGEIGVVKAFDEEKKEVLLSLDDGDRDIWVPTVNLDTYVLAWATSVHKSQGSEYPCVIYICSTAHYVMLSRSLLYTAATRARELLILIGHAEDNPRGPKAAIMDSIRNAEMEKRNSLLGSRITNARLSGALF